MSLTNALLLWICANTLMCNLGVWYLVGSRHAQVKDR